MKRKNLNLCVALLPLLAACATSPEEIHVIPAPQEVQLTGGHFQAAGAPVSYDAATVDEHSRQHIHQFAQDLTVVTGRPSRVAETAGEKGFLFRIDPAMAPESYVLEVDRRQVRVTAADDHGTLYAIRTLSQMLPASFFSKEAAPSVKWTIPCAVIHDAPRFAYRGMHLDVARHFFSVEEVKKYLDVMSLHKMNRFHWHLTEDQGWRIEIKKYPLLTEIGAWRDSTVVGHLRDMDKARKFDGQRYGGFYTQEQIRDVVAYAADLGITVIPEIDLPGHMLGALAAYPELGCTGGPYQVWCRWGISDQVLCPGKEETFRFLEDVLTEVMDLFPSEYIHIGGDECPKTEWARCPDCQRRIKALGLRDRDGHTAEQFLQNYVTARVQRFVNEHGRKIIGWDEILEGDLAEGATVMSWRGVKGGIEAARKGFDAIMTPNKYLYFDYYQTADKEKEPLAIGGCLPIDTVYVYEPLKDIPAEAQGHILGVQANLWTEYIARPDHLEYMLLPRMDALSEVQWCQPGRKDFDRFKADLSVMFDRYDRLGYRYGRQILGEGGLPGVPAGTN